MHRFWQKRKRLVVILGAALAVAVAAVILYAQPPGGMGMMGGMGDWQNRMATGTVAKVSGNQIVVKGRDGQNRTVVVGSNATILRFSKGSKADLKKSAIVRVMGKYDAKRAWFIPQSIHVGEGLEPAGPQAVLMGVGQISSVQNNQVYLTLPLALSNQTQISRGDKIPVKQVKVGEQIFAMGQPGANNVLNADRVTVGNLDAMLGRRGGGMMGGPGRRPGGGQRRP